MIPARETGCACYALDFYEKCTSLFLGFESGHLGPEMYCDHKGERRIYNDLGMLHAEPMSGVLTWDLHKKYGSLPHLCQQAFLTAMHEAANIIGDGAPVIEYGPGDMDNAKRLISVANSKLYIPVDISDGILDRAHQVADEVKGYCHVRPMVMDIFATGNPCLIEEQALAVSLGLTITNIPGPAPKAEPRDALIRTLRNLSRPIGRAGGYLLVSTHAEQNGEKNKALYNEPWHKKFGVNFLYRIKAELPTNGFNPDGFEYWPVWHAHCGLLAHTVRATSDQDFTMGEYDEIKVHVKEGDVFHYNNSFKYTPQLMESCAQEAELAIVDKWCRDDGMDLYLFKVVRGLHRCQ